MMTLVGSEGVADEPEFEQVIIDPILSVETFAQVGQELGVDPDSSSALGEQEREDIHLEMLEETTRRLLSDELRQDIIDGLNELRLRLKRSGGQDKAAGVAAVQSFLDADKDGASWPMIGLVQAIVYRSVVAGFELVAASEDLMEAVSQDQSEVPLLQRSGASSVAQKAEALLKKIPGLRGFMEKQADTIWEEGVDAIYEGELYLELFSPQELEAGFGVFKTGLGLDFTQEMTRQDSAARKVSEADARAFISRIEVYITELFTPQRLDQLRARLNTILNSAGCPKERLTFVFMLAEYMAAEDAVEDEKSFLVQALLGEMRTVVAELEGNDE